MIPSPSPNLFTNAQSFLLKLFNFSGPVPVMEEITKVQPSEKSPVTQTDVIDSSPLLH